MSIGIAFLARSLEVGGAEVQLAALARGLQRTAEFEVSVVTFYPGGALEAELRADGVQVLCAGKRGRWDLAGFGCRLRRLLRQVAPAVVHSFLASPNLAAAAMRPLLPGVRLVWGVRASDVDTSYYDWTWRAVYGAERILSRVPDRIVANSVAGRDHIARGGFPPGRIEVIANGIDTARFRPDRAAGAALRAQCGATGPLVGLAARFDRMKDHGTFLRAVNLLAARMPEVRYVCAGGGNEAVAREARALAESLGVDGLVEWAGERRDMPAFCNAIDIATLSSAFGEGFPNAVGEAMASGVPCAVTDVGDAAEIVGPCGAVVPRRDPAALAGAWERLLALPPAERAAMGEAARRRIEERYTAEGMVERSARLYRELLQAA